MTNPSQPAPVQAGCKPFFVLFFKLLAAAAAGLGLMFLVIGVTGNMNPFIGWVLALLLLSPMLIYMINRIVKQAKADGQLDKKSRQYLFIAAPIAAGLLIAIVYTLINLQGCQGRLAPGGALSGCDLSGRDFSGKNLSKADLRYADLSGANLTGANLSGANLTGAKLSRANLEGANLENAILPIAEMIDVTGLTDQELADVLKIPIENLYVQTAKDLIRLEDRPKIQAQLKGVCSGQPAASAHAYDPNQAFRTVMVFNGQGEAGAFSDYPVFKRWEPMAVRFTDLVVCVGDNEEHLVQTCQYEEGVDIERFDIRREITIRTAKTGEIVNRTVIFGPEPADCPVITHDKPMDLRSLPAPQEEVGKWLDAVIINN